MTYEFNTFGFVNLDCSGYETIVIQVESPSGTILTNTTNDDGTTTSVIGGPRTATGWQPIIPINVATNTANGAASITTSGLYRFQYSGQFLQLIGSSVTVGKLLIYSGKIGA